MGDIRFDGAPPPSGGSDAFYRIRILRLDERHDVTFLSERIFGVWCHWVFDPAKGRERSRACLDFAGECPYHQSRRVWLGYIAVFNNTTNTREVLDVGAEGAKVLAQIAAPHGGLWMVRRVLRLAQVGNKRVLFVTKAPGAPKMQLVAHDIRPTVKRLLGSPLLDDPEYDAREIIPLPAENGPDGVPHLSEGNGQCDA